MPLNEAEIGRFARQIVLPEVGGRGQERLRSSKVLVIGAGGLGSPLLLYLAAAGVGRLGLVDDDEVDLSNLHRQVIYAESDVGRGKGEAARDRLAELSSLARVEVHAVRLDATNADALVAGYDLVADGSDNVATRRAVADACHRQGKILVSAAVQGWDGQVTTYKPYEGPPHPCLRCAAGGTGMDEGFLPSCAQGGVVGPAAGWIGTLQAVEVVKELLSVGEGLSGRLLLCDALHAVVVPIKLKRDAACKSGCARLPGEREAGERGEVATP